MQNLIKIPNCSKDDLDQIYNQIFRLEKNEILVNEKIEVLDFDYYIRKVKELKEKINYKCKNDFNSIYAEYANITETLEKHHDETILSIYNNYQNEFKIKTSIQEKKTDKNKNDIYIMKRVVEKIRNYFLILAIIQRKIMEDFLNYIQKYLMKDLIYVGKNIYFSLVQQIA